MSYFDDKQNIEEYVKMCEGYDGKEHIDALRTFLKPGSTMLELGMGPGKDLDILKEFYEVTGSDFSQTFLDRYKEQNPEARLMILDAVKMNTDKTFDCIYSNKVLHHLSKQDLVESISNQCRTLTNRGIVLHTFWRGNKEENLHGMRFVYYTEEQLQSIFEKEFKIIEIIPYKEMAENDSIRVIASKV